MGNIVLLDELTINQIAAGEVIERPASAVKEMVENSIDAGATSITVEIKNGGISYIRITDNGKGIMPDDMEMSFERHATSKIRTADDLTMVKSMGFRGEALASIAAVANVEMISRTQDTDVGNKIVVEAGKIVEKQEVGAPIGTSITVTNLFFNTPVRYKFLKKDFTESGYIEDCITRLALVNPNVAFKLVNTGKVVLQTAGNGNVQGVIYGIYGKDVAEKILNVDYTYEDIHITGVIGKPEIARSNRGNQLFFVNKRYVKDKTLSSATEKGYKGLLTIGKYAFAILDLDMDPRKVDVNVHPAKLEVRFEEEGKVFKAIYHAINETLLRNDLIKSSEKAEEEASINFAVKMPEIKVEPSLFKNVSQLEKNSKTPETIGNVIEDLYNTRKIETIGGNGVAFNSSNNMVKKKEPLKEENKSEVQEVEEKKNNTLQELIELQRKIKEEVEQNKRALEERGVIADEPVAEEVVENKEELEEKLVDTTNPMVEEKIEELLPKEEEIETPKVDAEITQSLETVEEPEKEENEIVDDKDAVEEKAKQLEEKSNDLKEMIQQLENAKEGEVTSNFDEMYLKIFGKLPPKPEEEPIVDNNDASDLLQGENLSVFEESEDYKYKPSYKYIGIAFSTYIILEMQQELYIMDQHAAHERIMYEKVKKNFYEDTEKDSQLMILPDVITLTHKEMDIAKDNMELFEKAGFILEEFGDNTIKISGTPSICLDLNTKELFLETLDEINTVARTAKQEIEEKFIATVACKAAVKANMALTKEEVESLMDELLKLPNPFTCPHGRPTVIKMSKYEIERKFSRK